MTKDELLEIIKKEGDEKVFRYENYKCEIRRNQMGCWCGYIYVPMKNFSKVLDPVHVMNKIEETPDNYSNIDYFSEIVNCHGGVTYTEETTNGLYMIGFDCNHFNDLDLMSIEYDFKSDFATYKDKNFAIY